ncbi:sulfatase-like hydrolase/transferase [Aquipseudomonas ullengensis]|uniref:Sulfatase N-terminal domain-containing protein n=1 Tax=Aquipseudomonas ullengensis TaxID=2759166 RepID=A0A7W4QAG1_9GAMM|nr:sulfatase-like hydrolase/transferase [Pseudomonas ullengensis]MBB2495435.1 hypothetical protein [Pseudomonas ullengensis]
MRRIVPCVFFWLGAFFLPNAVLALCAYGLGVGRPAVNLDFAICTLLLAFGWRWLGAAALASVLVVDVLSLLGQVMPFNRVSDVLYLLQFSKLASVKYLLLVVLVLTVVLLLAAVVFYAAGRVNRLVALVSFNILALASVLAPPSETLGKSRYYRAAEYSWVESQSVAWIKARNGLFLNMFAGEGDPLVALKGKSASDPFWNEVSNGGGTGRMLLVVVESWGVPKEARIQDAILAPLRKLKLPGANYGEINYSGMTLAGELRELCHLYPEHYNLANVTHGFEGCLPNRLREKGFATASMHGATSLMYDRHHWYPRAGLDQRVFFEDRTWPQRCYSFPGACDLDLLPVVIDFFAQPGRRFFYWLTLNSHGPYDLRDLREDLFDCEAYGVAVDTESCRNFKLQAQFFEGFARLLSSPEMKGVEFVLVGDHVPMLLNVAEKTRSFNQEVVPWVSGVVR